MIRQRWEVRRKSRMVPSSQRMVKLGIVTSHPIQYQAPLHRALAKERDLDVTVLFTRNGGGKYFDEEFGTAVEWDIPLLDGYKHCILRNNVKRNGALSRIFTAWKYVFKTRFDVLWLYGWKDVANWSAWAAAKCVGTRVLLLGDTNALAEEETFVRRARGLLLRVWFKSIDGVLSVGTRNNQFYRSLGMPEEKIFFTPYAVDNDLFSRETMPQKMKQLSKIRYGLNPDLPTISFCGKLTPKKRPLDLVRAVARLKQGANLLFIGEGALRESIEAEAKKCNLSNLCIAGFCNQSGIAELYGMSDILVLPSCVEPWGLVVNEAMCVGLPIIASDKVGSAADLIVEGQTGFTYPVGDIDALTEKLEAVLANPDYLIRMGTAGRERIQHWSIKEDIAGVLRAIESCGIRN
ncbi:MAG: glycosyltransferase family 4 protein [Bryobacteraceae bacterium]